MSNEERSTRVNKIQQYINARMEPPSITRECFGDVSPTISIKFKICDSKFKIEYRVDVGYFSTLSQRFLEVSDKSLSVCNTP